MLYGKLVLMAVFWSGVFPAVNIVVQTMGIFTSVFLRFSAAALILLALLIAREGRFPRLTPRESVLVVGLGLLGIAIYNTQPRCCCANGWERRGPRASRCACSGRSGCCAGGTRAA